MLEGKNGNRIFLRLNKPFLEFWPIWEIEKLSEEITNLPLLDPASIEKMSSLGPSLHEHTFNINDGRLKIQESLIKEINLPSEIEFEGCFRIFRARVEDD